MKFSRYWHLAFIAIAVVISLYLRVLNPWNSVFTWTVRLGGNDPSYYFRLIDSCIHNFPSRLWFDAFTYYPYGTYTHFGPFLVYLGAIIAKLAGATDPESLKNVLVFIPAIGGTLLVFPVYLFVKETFNKEAGVISALLVGIIPGQLLARSLLGFNDHHVWEVFWMTTTLALYAYAINQWRNDPNAVRDRRKLAYAILAGVAFGMYLLTWAPSFFMALLIVIYTFIVMLSSRFIKADTTSIIYVSMITIGTAMLLYLPFAFNYPGFSAAHYSPFQLLVLLACTVVLAIFRGIEMLKDKGYYAKLGIKEEYAVPISLIVVAVVVICALFAISPDFLGILFGIIGVVQPKGGALTIAEVQPFFTMGGKFSLAPAYVNFATTFFFGFFGSLYLIWQVYKERKDTHILVLLWAVVMFIALCGQNRFAYYFAIVCAVTSGIILDWLLRTLRFYDAILNLLKSKPKNFSYTKFIVAVLLILVLFYPTFALAYEQSKYGGGPNEAWWDALVWLRNNTPNKEFYDGFYYKLYKPSQNLSKPYPYPNGTYGVMSWWDYGHWITAIGHRIPNANPFQQGIGNKYDNIPGAAPFFTAFNESYANSIADKLGVKYVISDIEMATGKFYAMAVWAEGTLEKAGRIYYAETWIIFKTPSGFVGLAPTIYDIPRGGRPAGYMNVPSENYFKTMEAKLHILDGCGLSHYRMVYESTPISPISFMGWEEVIYRGLFNNNYADKFRMPKVNVTTSGYVKIFEYVKGARITGKANASEVIVTLKIKTNQGRIITWQKIVDVVDGTYEVIVPYAQNTGYPVKPVGDYTIRAGDVVKTFSVSDEDVEEGRTIVVDLV